MKKKLTTGMAVLLVAMLAGTCMAETMDAEVDENVVAAEEDVDVEEENEEYEYADILAEWNLDTPAINVLIDYVEAVTDDESADFIPVEDRIAVFDMDGTLYAELFPTYLEYYAFAWRVLEDPSIQPDEKMLDVARTIRDHSLDKSYPDDMPMQHGTQAACAYAGMTLNEFSDFVTEILIRDADGFEGMTYGEAFYEPMIEVIDYLQENDFTCYVVSGSDRLLCRTLLEGMVDVPPANIIGMDVATEASGQGDTDGLDYVFSSGDDVIRTDRLLIKNIKMNKVVQIVQDIGKQPVLSFGNTSGDVSMHNYTLFNNPYRSAAFMLIADDEARDYGNEEKAQSLREDWEKSGYNVISMKNDFKTIYGEDVVKTGSFHWLEELAENRVPQPAPEEEESVGAADAFIEETAAENADAAKTDDMDGIQYVLFLGTNDKDTNEPVGTLEECEEQAIDILAEYVGGYTMQEARGGWVSNDGTLYEENSIVIYLSDTDDETVHNVADVLIEAFNQSSVLIQRSSIGTEFYYGE